MTTPIEQQLRRYATSVAGPPRHTPTALDDSAQIESSQAGPRRVFAVALVAVVVVAVGVAVLTRLQLHPSTPASATAEANGLRVRLEVNTTTPGPTQQVKATMTVTNTTDQPIVISELCPNDISIELDTPPTAPETSNPYDQFAGAFTTFESWTTFGARGHDPALVEPETCSRSDNLTLAPHQSASVDGVNTVGLVGLNQRPAHLVGRPYPPSFFSATASLPFTIPEPPAGRATRSDALDSALARPEVIAWANAVNFDPASIRPAAGATEAQYMNGVVRQGEGWKIYMNYLQHHLTVVVNSDGVSGTIDADGTTTDFTA